jgi:hypothetical protein
MSALLRLVEDSLPSVGDKPAPEVPRPFGAFVHSVAIGAGPTRVSVGATASPAVLDSD